MEKVNLVAKIREIFGRKTNKERKAGNVPAVIYGKGIETKNIWVNALDFRRLLKKHGESSVIDLQVGEKENFNVIINEIQRHPVSGNFLHLDFLRVRMDEKIEVRVDFDFVGEAPAVKELGGMLIKSLDGMEVSCFPGDLPSKIDVDISALKTFDDNIKVGDLKLSEKIEVLAEPDTVIVSVEEPRSEEEMKELDEKVDADVSKVEGVVKEAPETEGAEKEPASTKATAGEGKD